MGFEKDQFAGITQQLTPEAEQVVGAEGQIPAGPPTVIKESEKRSLPLPTKGVITTAVVTPEGEVEVVEPEPTPVVIYSFPVLRMNRYSGDDQEWQELVRWDIPAGFVGDLHEISVVSDNDSVTRYRVIIGNIDQQLPTDRATQTPVNFPWRSNDIPGGTSVYIAVLSTDGTTINVDGLITGTKRIPTAES